MEQKKKVKFRKEASESIAKIANYIVDKGYPKTSKKFTDKLYEFGHSLNIFPDKYPLCRNAKLAKRNLRCAVFKDYAFIYKVVHRNLVLYNVIHGKRMR